jgi:poly(A) polymerase
MRKAAQRIINKLRLHGYEAFFAGGWVRDFLLRRTPKDIDIATSARPDEVLRLFPKSRSIGAQFGVIQVLMYGHAYEVATFRSDNAYHDGRHPSSVVFSGPEEDADRRDFTINGLFYDPAGNRLIDYVLGKADIQNRLIRTIGDPFERFAEDKLRMLRALRFSCELGFAIVPETWQAIQKLAPEILQISWERIRDELIKIFTGPAPDSGLNMLHASGLLQHILPEVAAMRGIPPEAPPGMDVFAHTQDVLARLHKPSAVLALGALLHDAGKTATYSVDTHRCFLGHAQAGAKISEEIGRRLKMSNEEIFQIADLVSTHEDFAQINEMRESGRQRLLRRPNIDGHLELFRANCLSNNRNLDAYITCVQKAEEYRQAPAPLIKGEDLLALGYAPGPVFGEILRTVEDLQLEGILKTHEDALRHIKTAFPVADKSPSKI